MRNKPHPQRLQGMDAAAWEWIEHHGRRVGLEMYRQNAEAAHAAVEAGLADRAQPPTTILDTPLALAGLATRSVNTLERHLGVTTVGALLATTRVELLAVPEFGEAQVFAALAALANFAVRRAVELEHLIPAACTAESAAHGSGS